MPSVMGSPGMEGTVAYFQQPLPQQPLPQQPLQSQQPGPQGGMPVYVQLPGPYMQQVEGQAQPQYMQLQPQNMQAQPQYPQAQPQYLQAQLQYPRPQQQYLQQVWQQQAPQQIQDQPLGPSSYLQSPMQMPGDIASGVWASQIGGP